MSRRIQVLPLAVAVVCVFPTACRPKTTAPQFAYVESRGCADLLVFGWNAQSTEQLVVEADRNKLAFGRGTHAYDVSAVRDGLKIHVDLYSKPPFSTYCTHIFDSEQEKPVVWRAKSGAVALTLSDMPAGQRRAPSSYWAVVTLQDMEFEGPHGEVITAKGPLTIRAEVGWLSGG